MLWLFVISVVFLLVIISKHPKYTLYFLGFSLGLNFTLLSEPVHVSVPQIFAMAVIAAVALRKILIKGGLGTRRYKLWAWSGLLVTAASLPSLAFAVVPGRALAGSIQLVEISLLIYVSVLLFASDRVSIHRVCQFIVLGAVISAFHALGQAIFLPASELFLRGDVGRVYGSYGQPNSYGQYLAGVIPLTLVLFSRYRRYAAPFLLLSLTLLLTGSRGATLSALAACTLILGLLQFKRRSNAVLVTLTAGAGAAIGLAFFPPTWLKSMLTISDWPSQQRLLALITAWRGISHRPLVGYGPGSFQFLMPDFKVAGLTDDIEMPHNFLLDIWFELGFLALAVFLVLVFLYYYMAVRAYLRSGDVHLLALLGAVSGLLVASMFGTLIVRGISEFLAILVGMTAGRIRFLTLATLRRAER